MWSLAKKLAVPVLVAANLMMLGSIAVGQVQWTRQPACGLDLAAPGEWDGGGLDSTEVIFRDGQFEMWYVGSDNGGGRSGHQIGYATSPNGCDWERHPLNPVLRSVLPWETSGVVSPAVVHDGTDYEMWYGGWVDTISCDIGLATAGNPVEWLRYSEQPVLSGPEVPASCVRDACVLFDGSTYRMWYSATFFDSVFQIGLATSSDGIHWKQYAGNPVFSSGNGASSPTVIFDEATSSFELWVSVFPSQVVYAVSVDGKLWRTVGALSSILGENSVLVSNPSVVRLGNDYHVWYNTSDSGTFWRDIRYATAEWTVPRVSFTREAALIAVEEGVEEEDTGFAPLHVKLDGSNSATPHPGGITRYSWDFGDGSSAEGVESEKTYPPGHYFISLAVTDPTGQTVQVTRSLRVLFPSGPVDPWTAVDLGAPSFPGGSRRDGDCLEVLEAFGDLRGVADQAHFLYRKVSGDFRLEGQVDEWTPSATSELGLMARASLDAGAQTTAVVLRASSVYLLRRPGDSVLTSSDRIGTFGGTRVRLRLERRGEGLRFFYSVDAGRHWIAGELSSEVRLPSELYVGLVASGRTANAPALARVCELGMSPLETDFQRGEANADGELNLSDAIFAVEYLFMGGEAPSCLKSADSNDDGDIDLADPIYLVGRLFLGGPEPDAPTNACGVDLTVDDLSCEEFLACP